MFHFFLAPRTAVAFENESSSSAITYLLWFSLFRSIFVCLARSMRPRKSGTSRYTYVQYSWTYVHRFLFFLKSFLKKFNLKKEQF